MSIGLGNILAVITEDLSPERAWLVVNSLQLQQSGKLLGYIQFTTNRTNEIQLIIHLLLSGTCSPIVTGFGFARTTGSKLSKSFV